MSLLLDRTSINREPLAALAKDLSHDREAFLQLLLEFSTRSTFNRIVHCPTYPIRTLTQDLEYRKQLLFESITSDPYEISYALAFLYEAAAGRERRKDQGQFFTPAFVAIKAATSIALKPGETLLDPGCGTGIFPLAILRGLAMKSGDPGSFAYLGVENDPLLALATAVSLDRANAS
ncbi:SAM-dependent methyltransferase, partial [Candidatus Bathyarchaeota archaeon]|nr:SAM-dependent methyltransferase [Candidatus Bathyarchaeota archaeon]